jgi:hypothetical protein
MHAPILAPAAVLVCWSLVMLIWLVRARQQAMAAAGMNLGESRPGGRGQDLQGRLPDAAMWPSHNYTHLMEQPTLFYAAVTILAIAGPSPGTALGMIDLALAWAYALLRIVHSMWQARVNRIPERIALFRASTFCLIGLALSAAWATLIAG